MGGMWVETMMEDEAASCRDAMWVRGIPVVNEEYIAGRHLSLTESYSHDHRLPLRPKKKRASID